MSIVIILEISILKIDEIQDKQTILSLRALELQKNL